MSPKAALFVAEYLKDLNATQAAIRAGYSQRTANQQGPALLVKLGTEIAEAMTARTDAVRVDAAWVLKRLHDEATADLASIYDDNGHLRPIAEWPMVFRTGLVAGVETAMERDGADEDGKPQFVTVRKIKLSDRVRLVELIGKHVGVQAFKDRIEVMDVTPRATRLRAARERSKASQ